MSSIENYYDNQYDEWERLDRHKIEFEVTKRYMDKYITKPNLDILDIGGGPGRYSFYLAEKGHNVTLLDLSQHNIDVAKEKSKELNIDLVDYIKGNALEMDDIKGQYDVVLLMGPLYHLIEKKDRRKALENALKLLKKDGIIIASFISNYAPIQDCLSYMYFDGDDNDVDNLVNYITDGVNDEDKGFTTAYFTSSEEAKELMSEYGLNCLAFAGVENLTGCKERDILLLPEKDIEKWIEIAYRLSSDEKLLGVSQHYLYIGRK